MDSQNIKNIPLNLFFSGIAGSGVSALALFMAFRGHRVSGSDRQFDTGAGARIKNRLQAAGVRIFPQDGSAITEAIELMIISTAVEKDRPEMVSARELGISIMTRPEFLDLLSRQFKAIAIAGTSGKSTTSAMIAFALERLGQIPNFIGGGRAKDFRTSTNPGNVLTGESPWLVMEADESDGSIVNYRPAHSVISNLALDHNPVAETAAMFQKLADNTSGTVALNADDQDIMKISASNALTYSINAPSDLRAEDVLTGPTGSSFRLNGQEFKLATSGLHNVQNALAAISVLHITGFSLKDMAGAMSAFSGIERRFDVHLNRNGKMVIDDYAHNPHKIDALMGTMSGIAGRTCYIFQPHGFGPLRLMLNEYADVFRRNLRLDDRLSILPVYYTGGTVARDISSNDLASLCDASAPSSRQQLIEDITSIEPFDKYVVFGARDDSLSDLTSEIARIISSRVVN